MPPGVQRLFWEYGDREFRWPDDAGIIIQKVLQVGEWEDLRWLRGKIGDEGIRRWLLEHEGAGLSRKQLRFWQTVLHLPGEKVDHWVKRLEESPWEMRHRR